MSKFYIIFLLSISFLISPLSAQAKINIFACEPEWESLGKEIGGDYVQTFSAISAHQDAHYIRAKPSLIAKIRKADLLICSGSDLEVGWLPILLSKANKNIQVGKIGYLMASDFVPKLDKTNNTDRSLGDIHPHGNPHIHLNPHNILLVAKQINDRLQKIEPDNAKNYQKNYDNFVQKWTRSIEKWEAKADQLKGMKIVSHHKSFSYLIAWLELDEVAVLESKPGIAPSLSYLKDLLSSLKKEPVKIIIRTPYDPEEASDWVLKKTKIKDLVLPYTVGGNDQSTDLFFLFDSTINLLIENK
ncbi:MAG: zinc/manganese transport system substrate-binding protein [Myxococcota bacterium]|jgi:zinc/manganese transport system substrate-binding protein